VKVHAVEVEPEGHALVEGGQCADLAPLPDGGLAEQQAGERGVGVFSELARRPRRSGRA